MKRIDTATKAVDLFGAGKHGFKAGNVLAGEAATKLAASWFNHTQEELASLVEQLFGVELNDNEMNQLATLFAAKFALYATTASLDGKYDKAGGAVTGLIDSTIAAGAGLRLTISDNTASIIQSIILRRGDGTGTAVQVQTRGDAANGIDQLRLNFTDGQSYAFNKAGNLALGADPSAALDAATKQYVDSRLVPTGTTILFNGTSAPAGFLKENGAAVSRTTYAGLFAVIGTTYGVGDGATTFNLPESRAEFFRGLDDGRGIDAGRALGSTQTDDLKSHRHALSKRGANNSNTSTSLVAGALSASTAFDADIMDLTGGAETRPRNVPKLVCIKY